MKWNIVADSSCDLMSKDISCDEVGFSTIPFVLNIGGKEFIDDENLNISNMIEEMENCPTACGSACPSPQQWAEHFEKAQNSIAITISGNLSGSLSSAAIGKEMALEKYPEKNIMVLNSYSTGPETALCIYKLAEWIKNGDDFSTVQSKAENFLKDTHTCFALSSFDNLVKNGRMSKLTGFVARKLGMWGIGIATEEGTIAMKGKSRGPEKAINIIIQDMKERGFSGEQVAISHCFNKDMVERLSNRILELWPGAEIMTLTTRGLDSFYAERGGLIVAYK